MFGRLAFCPPRRPIGPPCCTLIGNLLWKLMAAAMVTPPTNKSAGAAPVAHFFPFFPNGSSTIGAMITRCGTSMIPVV